MKKIILTLCTVTIRSHSSGSLPKRRCGLVAGGVGGAA